MPTNIGSLNSGSTARSIITSIRTQIPDPVDDPIDDGAAFTMQQLVSWLNDAMRVLCTNANVIQDWYAIPSAVGMSIYQIPNYINSAEQLWYNLYPTVRSPEMDNIFVTKITARSWWFGPHSIHAMPRIHVWPACDTAGAVTTLNGTITADATTINLTNASGFLQFGFMQIENELILYQSVTGNVITNILRGQGGTTPAVHNTGVPVTCANIFFKCYRLPVPLTGVDDVIEVPQGLWPLLELYVISKVRESEQDSQTAMMLMKEFLGLVDKLSSKSVFQGLRQGIQVRTQPVGPDLFMGRIFIP